MIYLAYVFWFFVIYSFFYYVAQKTYFDFLENERTTKRKKGLALLVFVCYSFLLYTGFLEIHIH